MRQHCEEEYWVPPHARVCVTPTGAVLLDLKRNRYFGLGSREARSLATLALNWSRAATQSGIVLDSLPADEAQRLADALVKAGFLTQVEPKAEPCELGAVHLDEALAGAGHELQPADVRLNLHHVLTFVRACIWARRATSSRLFYSIAHEIAERKRGSTDTGDLQRAIALVCAFRRLRPFAFATKDRCLFHALALLKFLSLYGIFPTWVIAVRPRPWAAHSWLQLGSLVLDCNPEEISGYTPILAV